MLNEVIVVIPTLNECVLETVCLKSSVKNCGCFKLVLHLLSHKLYCAIQNNSYSTIGNIFIDTFKFSNFTVYPIINGLSDHNARSLILHEILVQNTNTYFYYNKKIDKLAVINFNTKLSYESWEDIFTENDVNTILTNFWICT